MEEVEYAAGRSWHVCARKPSGGFCFVHENAVWEAWSHLQSGAIALRDFRVWLACFELVARRCRLAPDRQPRYTLDELRELVGGVGGEHIRASLRRLENARLAVFNEHSISLMPEMEPAERGRPVPVARKIIRLLAGSRGRAFIATTLGHVLRCMFYRGGECRSGGWCKASWIASTFGVALRAVKEARRRLLAIGLLRSLRANQLRLNRFGSPLVVALNWVGETAPRSPEFTTESAPPIQHEQLSLRRADHQKPARTADPTGARTRAHEPDLRNVTVADLKDPWRLAALFKQARLRGWVRRTEANILAAFAAAAHATRVGRRNTAGLFVAVLRSNDWGKLSIGDEDRGRHMLRELREICRPRLP